MKLSKFLILYFIGLFQWGFSQGQKFPFGVETPLYWVQPQEENGNVVLKEQIKKQVLATQSLSEAKKINHNWAFAFDYENGFSFPLELHQAEQYSIFIVYEPKHPKHEQNLWYLTNLQTTTPLIAATNRRLADYTGGEFRSYPEKLNKEKVKIHYYQHYKNLDRSSERQDVRHQTRDLKSEILDVGGEKREANSQSPTANQYQLNLGGKATTLPPLAFSGYVSEVLVYDRVLSHLERQQVASYLAIKYGVSLHQFHYKNYYNSKGEKIWDYEKHKAFNQNITGLGKDQKSSLQQPQSLNSNDEQVVAMRISSKVEIPDDYFVFWSDNGKGLKVEKQKEGQPQGISRVWALDYQPNDQIQLDLGIDLRNIETSSETRDARNNPQTAVSSQQIANRQLPSADYFWLVLDQSGAGEFSPKNTEYIKLSAKGSQQVATRVPPIANSGPRISNFTIWQAPEMFAHLDLKQGRCQGDELAQLQFKMVGGEAPYQIKVRSLGQNLAPQTWVENYNQGQKQLQLSSGQYIYEVRDRYNQTYIQELYLTDEDAPQPKLNAEYILGKESTVLDASKGLPKGHYTYEWYQEGQLLSQNATYLLNQVGSYELRVKNEAGCHSVVYFKVLEQIPQMSETKVVIYPNPSTDGHFKVLASFPKITSGILSIYDTAGRLLSTKDFYNLSQYEYDGHLTQMGVYIIHLKTSLGESSYKLIVEK